MAATLRTILLVAERPGINDDGRSITRFLDRLELQGMTAQVVCLDADGKAESDARVVVASGLRNRWRQAFAVRALRVGERLARPDLIHVLETSMAEVGLAIAEYWRTPYVLTVDEFLGPAGKLRISRRWCRGLIAASRELAEDLRDELGVPAAMVREINPGIEPPAERPSRPDDARLPVVGTAGPLVPSAGFATFLNAAKRVTESGVDAEFVIAGRGEEEVDLRRRADRLKIADRVTFASIPVLGPRFWEVLDVYCQPSLAPSVGRSLATAMASGVPAVVSEIEGLKALVEPGVSGLTAPPGDSGALAAAVIELLESPARAEELGRHGRSTVLRDFGPEAETRLLAGAYAEALAALAPGAESATPG